MVSSALWLAAWTQEEPATAAAILFRTNGPQHLAGIWADPAVSMPIALLATPASIVSWGPPAAAHSQRPCHAGMAATAAQGASTAVLMGSPASEDQIPTPWVPSSAPTASSSAPTPPHAALCLMAPGDAAPCPRLLAAKTRCTAAPMVPPVTWLIPVASQQWAPTPWQRRSPHKGLIEQGSCAQMDSPSALMVLPAVNFLMGSMAAAQCLMPSAAPTTCTAVPRTLCATWPGLSAFPRRTLRTSSPSCQHTQCRR